MRRTVRSKLLLRRVAPNAAQMASVLGSSSRASGAPSGQGRGKLKRRRRRRCKRKGNSKKFGATSLPAPVCVCVCAGGAEVVRTLAGHRSAAAAAELLPPSVRVCWAAAKQTSAVIG